MRTVTVQVADEFDLQSINNLLRRHGLCPVGETWEPVPVHAMRRIVFTFADENEGAQAYLLLGRFLLPVAS